MNNKEAGKSVPEATECKVAPKPHDFGRHQTKIGPNPNVFAYFKSPWTGADMHIWGYGWNMPWENVTTFLKSHLYNKKTNYNRFCVSMHFATNRSTLEKFPPPPPLLHPTSYQRRPSSPRKREGNVRFPTNLHGVRRSARPTSRWAPKAHRMMGKTQ